MLQQTVGLPKLLSLAIAIACVGFLSWRGSGFIEKAKTWGSAALYLGYCAFAVLVFTARWRGGSFPWWSCRCLLWCRIGRSKRPHSDHDDALLGAGTYHCQSSTTRSGTLRNSRTLLVTNVRPRALA